MDSSPKDVTEAYLELLYEEQQGKSYEGFQNALELQSSAPLAPQSLATSFGSGEGTIREVWAWKI